jgi:hypothetical protein
MGIYWTKQYLTAERKWSSSLVTGRKTKNSLRKKKMGTLPDATQGLELLRFHWQDLIMKFGLRFVT